MELGGAKGKIPTKLKEKTPAGMRQRAVLLLQENSCQVPMVEEKKTRELQHCSPEGATVTLPGDARNFFIRVAPAPENKG